MVVKSDGAMDAVIAATTAPDTQKFSAPSHYTDSGTFYNGMLNLALDAGTGGFHSLRLVQGRAADI